MSTKSLLAVGLVLFTTAASGQDSRKLRTWTTTDGREFEATFHSFDVETKTLTLLVRTELSPDDLTGDSKRHLLLNHKR